MVLWKINDVIKTKDNKYPTIIPGVMIDVLTDYNTCSARMQKSTSIHRYNRNLLSNRIIDACLAPTKPKR